MKNSECFTGEQNCVKQYQYISYDFLVGVIFNERFQDFHGKAHNNNTTTVEKLEKYSLQIPNHKTNLA